MINLEQQTDFFKLIGRELKGRIECLVIGGSAMMFLGSKEATKDVDLVFMDEKSRSAVMDVLSKIGFRKKENIVKIFQHYEIAKNKPVMMEGRDTRFDLFVNEVICFRITDSMIDRIKEVHEFDNLIVKVISPEDILLLKCATERAKDRDDAKELINKYNIKWDNVIEESLKQTKKEEEVFPVFLFDFLYELKEDYKLDIPKEVIDKVRKISEKIMIERLKKGTLTRTTIHKKKS